MGYGEFVRQFTMICQKHLEEGRARAFAFVFYDMRNGYVRQALSDANGFRWLHEKTGRDITLFYLHTNAVDAHARSFNKHFMAALGIQDQAEPPCMVFFRVNGEDIEDVLIYEIDEQAADPVLVSAELDRYVGEAIKRIDAEGDFSALIDLRKVVAPIFALTKLGEFIYKLKGLA